jgi:hypothetical protein
LRLHANRAALPAVRDADPAACCGRAGHTLLPSMPKVTCILLFSGFWKRYQFQNAETPAIYDTQVIENMEEEERLADC